MLPADPAHLLFVELEQILSVIKHLSALDLPIGLRHKAHDPFCEGCLSGAGFSHKPMRSAFFQRKVNAIERLYNAFAHLVMDRKILNF